MMFNKLTFEELSVLYGAVATLENHYGKEAVHNAVKEMSDKLDRTITGPRIISGTITTKEILTAERVDQRTKETTPKQLSFMDPEPKGRKGQKIVQTKERRMAENMARLTDGVSLEEYLIDRYYKQGWKQKDIATALDVAQTSVSRWIRKIPQKTIKRIVGDKG